jgi:hypothetical protein
MSLEDRAKQRLKILKVKLKKQSGMSPAVSTIATMILVMVYLGAIHVISEFGYENLELHQYNRC